MSCSAEEALLFGVAAVSTFVWLFSMFGDPAACSGFGLPCQRSVSHSITHSYSLVSDLAAGMYLASRFDLTSLTTPIEVMHVRADGVVRRIDGVAWACRTVAFMSSESWSLLQNEGLSSRSC